MDFGILEALKAVIHRYHGLTHMFTFVILELFLNLCHLFWGWKIIRISIDDEQKQRKIKLL